jgi:hypothetical protein
MPRCRCSDHADSKIILRQSGVVQGLDPTRREMHVKRAHAARKGAAAPADNEEVVLKILDAPPHACSWGGGRCSRSPCCGFLT